MSRLRIQRSVGDQLRAHAEAAYPHECCGVLVGSVGAEGWTVAFAVPVANSRTDSPQNRYAIAPVDLVKIMAEARKHGLEVAGFYHSHPDHPAMWSQIDLDEAHWLGCSYVITEVPGGRATVTNSFLLSGTKEEDKQFVPQRIELID
jgi:proteasome lid subunit RPN8/RPN11